MYNLLLLKHYYLFEGFSYWLDLHKQVGADLEPSEQVKQPSTNEFEHDVQYELWQVITTQFEPPLGSVLYPVSHSQVGAVLWFPLHVRQFVLLSWHVLHNVPHAFLKMITCIFINIYIP